MNSFRYVGVTIIRRDHCPNTFDIVENVINMAYLAYTVAFVVLLDAVDVAANATKCIQ